MQQQLAAVLAVVLMAGGVASQTYPPNQVIALPPMTDMSQQRIAPVYQVPKNTVVQFSFFSTNSNGQPSASIIGGVVFSVKLPQNGNKIVSKGLSGVQRVRSGGKCNARALGKLPGSNTNRTVELMPQEFITVNGTDTPLTASKAPSFDPATFVFTVNIKQGKGCFFNYVFLQGIAYTIAIIEGV